MSMNRRKFLKTGGQMVGAALLSNWQFGFLKQAMAQTTAADLPRFLVCIRPSDNGLSAWDSPWFHQPVNPSWLVAGETNDYKPGAFRYPAAKYMAGPVFKDPNRLDSRLSYLFGTDYGWTSSDFDNFTVLRGIDFGGTGVHGQNLRPFQCGNRSPYAQDFSIRAAVAQKLSPMTLYYTSLSGSLLSNKGQESSPFANPVMIAGSSVWSSMTSNAGDGALPDSIDLKKTTAVRSLATSQTSSSNPFRNTQYAAYDQAIAGARSLQAGNYYNEATFRKNWNRYHLAILDAQIAMMQEPNCALMYSAVNGGGLGNLTSTSTNPDGTTGQRAQIATISANYPNTRQIGSYNTTAYDAYAFNMAWRFATAEQLIRLGLSRIIDIEMPLSDPHHVNGEAGASLEHELMLRTAVNVGWREFMKDVRKIYLKPDGTTSATPTSVTAFDRMAGLMFDQFDRTPTLSDVGGGSNHHVGASAYLFGGLFNLSRIFGANSLGTAAPQTGGFAGFNAPVNTPLPVDLNTGMPLASSAGGVSLNFSHIFPTVCAAMNVTVPLQQVNNFSAIKALVKS